MKSKRSFAVVLVTAPDLKVARKLARMALESRLAACVNFLPGVESHYWWLNKIEKGREVMMIIKTMRSNLRLLHNLIVQHHPYDTPEFIVLPIQGGSRKYLDWIQGSMNR